MKQLFCMCFCAFFISDSDQSIISAMKAVCNYYPIQYFSTVPFSLNQNNVEIQIKLSKQTMNIALNNGDNKKNWVELIPLICEQFNKRIIVKYGLSRSEIHYNRKDIIKLCNDIEVQDEISLEEQINLDKLMELRKKYYNVNRKPSKTYNLNDIVYIPRRHIPTPGVSTILNPPYEGPFRVLELKGKNAKLQHLSTKNALYESLNNLKRLDLAQYVTELRNGPIGQVNSKSALNISLQTPNVSERNFSLLDDNFFEQPENDERTPNLMLREKTFVDSPEKQTQGHIMDTDPAHWIDENIPADHDEQPDFNATNLVANMDFPGRRRYDLRPRKS